MKSLVSCAVNDDEGKVSVQRTVAISPSIAGMIVHVRSRAELFLSPVYVSVAKQLGTLDLL